jgi:hypothetical protein
MELIYPYKSFWLRAGQLSGVIYEPKYMLLEWVHNLLPNQIAHRSCMIAAVQAQR